VFPESQHLQGRQARQRRQVADLRIRSRERLQGRQASQRRKVADLRIRDIKLLQGRQVRQRRKIGDLRVRDDKRLQVSKSGDGPDVGQALVAIAGISTLFSLPIQAVPLKPFAFQRQRLQPDQVPDLGGDLGQSAVAQVKKGIPGTFVFSDELQRVSHQIRLRDIGACSKVGA